MSARNRSLTACTSCSHLSGLTCDHARKSLSCICRNMSTSPVTTSSKSASASERSSPTACLPSSGNIGVELPSGCPPSTGKTVYGQHHPGAHGKNSRGKPFYTAPCWPTKTTPLYLWSNTEKHQLWLCYTISIMTERKEKKILWSIPLLTPYCGVPCVKIYILWAHKWETKVYIGVSGVQPSFAFISTPRSTSNCVCVPCEPIYTLSTQAVCL